MKRTVYSTISIGLLLLLPGCGRIIEWGKSNFYQGEEMHSFANEVEPYLRSVIIYDQLETKGWFDVLWLSDAVRAAYAKQHIERLGQDDEKYNAVLRRQLEENNHYISFYVLSTYETKLGTLESHWAFFLRINGKDYHPFEMKKVELPYEYQQFFGALWNRFKEPHLMRFRLLDENDQPILTENTPALNLYARSADKEHVFSWQLRKINPLESVSAIENKKKKKKVPIKQSIPRQHWPRKRKAR